MGVDGHWINQACVRIQVMVLKDDKNTNTSAIFHWNWGYDIAQLHNPRSNWIDHRTAQDSSDVE